VVELYLMQDSPSLVKLK